MLCYEVNWKCSVGLVEALLSCCQFLNKRFQASMLPGRTNSLGCSACMHHLQCLLFFRADGRDRIAYSTERTSLVRIDFLSER